MSQPRVTYGGQALIEGVMIRGVTCVSVAVRRPNGEILTTTEPIRWEWTRRLRSIPLVRGVIVLAEMLNIGTRALLFSAQIAAEEEPRGAAAGAAAKEGGLSSVAIGGTLVVSLLLTIGLFFALPVFVTRLADPFLGSNLLSNLFEGLIRLGLFLGYIAAIGFMPDIRRVFAYHGAEHMSVHAQEHGDPLTVEAVRKYPTAHPRCGTAFLLVVLVVAILAHIMWTPPVLWERIASRILLLPLIAGISYEVIRWSGMHAENFLVKAIIAPNLLLQSLTTRQPDDKQIEVAIKAVEAAVERDQKTAQAVQA